ncbi:MAG: HEAT repeat domain-containing protein [Planctomycetes bacterium]|nr:HEAT repeat domain-containing protein [Planctomycetota bacterium]
MVRIFQVLCVVVGIGFLSSLVLGRALEPGGREIPSKVKSDLRSRFEKDRRGAVRKLAEIGSEEAWDLILVAMQDVKGQVADEAQWQLTFAPAPADTLQKLYGEMGLGSKDEWVVARAAEILGQIPGPVDPEALLKEVSKKRALASLACLVALQNQQARGALDWGKDGDKAAQKAGRKVERMLSWDPALASQALLTLAELDRERADEMCSKMGGHKEPDLRAAALMASHRIQSQGTLSLAAVLAGDEDSAVRGVAQRVLQKIGTKQALLLLAKRLDEEPREKLLLELVPRLQAMTGFKGGRNGDVWTRYAGDLPDDWQAEDYAEEAEEPQGKQEQVSSVSASPGLPTYSDRIVYLMDFSGSIWNERPNGKTRKEMLDPMLHRTLDALRDGTHFNLGPYTGEVSPWQPSLVEAKGTKVKAAHKFIDDIKITGPGDFYLAVQWALEDRQVDTICELTDGAPSGGRHWRMEQITERLLAQGELRPIRYDIVLVDAPSGLKQHWQRLADGSGGKLQELKLDD